MQEWRSADVKLWFRVRLRRRSTILDRLERLKVDVSQEQNGGPHTSREGKKKQTQRRDHLVDLPGVRAPGTSNKLVGTFYALFPSPLSLVDAKFVGEGKPRRIESCPLKVCLAEK